MAVTVAAPERQQVETRAPIIDLTGVEKVFRTGKLEYPALRGVDLTIEDGQMVAIVGPSGSGKTTIMNLITGIDRPTAGVVSVDGRRLNDLSEEQLAVWRGGNVGIVFQFFQLLPTLTIAENVMLPMDFCRTFPARERRGRAVELLDRVGIAEQGDKLPATLSGGQLQRAAIARALANAPSVILADEPTGNLDSSTAADVLRLFRGLATAGTTVVIATHERDIARTADRVVGLADGAIVGLADAAIVEERPAAAQESVR
jgi:putative ABC transport system ATP-binding protein